VESALAGNIFQRHVILGHADPSRMGGKLDGLRAVVRRNGGEVASASDLEASTGAIVAIVGHVAKVLARFGERLAPGEFIIAGSIVPPLFLDARDEEVELRLEPLGSVGVRFARGG
jgi:2-keto-4-pentenoate hydratase